MRGGWSGGDGHQRRNFDVLPYARGVVRSGPCCPGPPPGAPRMRMRGGGPYAEMIQKAREACSPYARGWSDRPADRPDRVPVLPVCAGVVRRASCCASWSSRAPRMRGGGPKPVPVGPGSGQCSPYARGWSAVVVQHHPSAGVLPAYAGVVRCRRSGHSAPYCAPRIHGVVRRRHQLPVLGGVLLAYAGVVPRPRAAVSTPAACSPHTRGWSPVDVGAGNVEVVLPVYAGVVRSSSCPSRRGLCAPRTCGGGSMMEGRPASTPCVPCRRGGGPTSSPVCAFALLRSP